MSATSDATVIGLGPMGRAMTRSLLGNGYSVTVWNRTPSRADGVVAAGARWASTPAEAVAASELVLLSLTDYQAMWDILGGETASLSGRILVNLSSDTPERTREAASWARSHGATFLAGGVMVPAFMLGTEHSYVYYSGDGKAFDAHRGTLAHIGDPRFLGEEPERAQLMYQAQLAVFLTTLSGFMQATALVGSSGGTAAEFLPEVMQLFRAIPEIIAEDGVETLGRQIDAGKHPGEESTATMMGATADHIVASSAAAGLDTALPRAVRDHYRHAIEEGHGAEGWTRIIDGIRVPSAAR